MNQSKRRGFSLMEVMFASAILTGSLIALDQLATMGRQNANSAETMVTAQLLCEQKMNLMLSGMERLESTDDSTWEENEDWHYAVRLTPTEKMSLTELEVEFWQDEEKFHQPQRYNLIRWITQSETSDGPESTVEESSL